VVRSVAILIVILVISLLICLGIYAVSEEKKTNAKERLQNDLNLAIYERLSMDNAVMVAMKALIHEAEIAKYKEQSNSQR
jgi:competence protein ComGC